MVIVLSSCYLPYPDTLLVGPLLLLKPLLHLLPLLVLMLVKFVTQMWSVGALVRLCGARRVV